MPGRRRSAGNVAEVNSFDASDAAFRGKRTAASTTGSPRVRRFAFVSAWNILEVQAVPIFNTRFNRDHRAMTPRFVVPANFASSVQNFREPN
jgi:hypothetical protein